MHVVDSHQMAESCNKVHNMHLKTPIYAPKPKITENLEICV